MKALKVAVVGLLIVVAGLLFTIRRLADRPASGETPMPAPTQAAVALPSPQPEAVPPPQPEKPSPVAPKKGLTRPRQTAARTEPPPSPAIQKPAEAPSAAPPAAAPVAEAPSKPAPPPPPRHVTIQAGTALIVRTQNTLSTERNLKGDTFTATLEEPLVVDGFVIAERGADVEGTVMRAEKAGRVEGTSSLAIELVRLHASDGQKLSLATNLHEVQGERSRGSDAKKVGAATGIGAIIGAIAGGGKGAAIGAGVGAGTGAGAVLATRGKDAAIPSETRLTFHLRAPLEVTERH